MSNTPESKIHLLGKESRDRAEAVGKAAWIIEDTMNDQLFTYYPSQKEARDLCIENAYADRDCKWALALMVFLTIFEVPPWCDTTRNQWWFPDPGDDRCQIKDVNVDDLFLSGIAYWPPYIGLIIECCVLVPIARKALLEMKLQKVYFDPLRGPDDTDYPIKSMNKFIIAMVLFEIVDMLVFLLVRPRFRLAFIARTTFLAFLPWVRKLVLLITKVIVQMATTGVFLLGMICLFAWMGLAIFIQLDGSGDDKHHPPNKGLDSIPNALNSMFVAGNTDDFIGVLLPSYTHYRLSGLMWFAHLSITHVLLLSLVLDTLVSSYMESHEQDEGEEEEEEGEEAGSEEGSSAGEGESEGEGPNRVERTRNGITLAFDTLAKGPNMSGNGEKLSKDAVLAFIMEVGRCPAKKTITMESAIVMYEAAVNRNDEGEENNNCDGSVGRAEFCNVCSMLQSPFKFSETDSPLKEEFPWIWNSTWFQKVIESVKKKTFDTIMDYILLVNLLLVCVEVFIDLHCKNKPHCEVPNYMKTLELLFSFTYVFEVGIKLSVHSWRHYSSQPANLFDFVTTWLLLFSSVAEELNLSRNKDFKKYMNMLRLLRLLRVLKKLKNWKSVQFVTKAIATLATRSKKILLLLGVVVFFFTALGVQLWGGMLYIRDELKETEYGEKKYYVFNFNDVLMSFGTWVVILFCEYLQEFGDAVVATAGESHLMKASRYIFYVFYVASVCVVFELVKAFTIEVFVTLTKEHNKEEDKDHPQADQDQAVKRLEAVGTFLNNHGLSLHVSKHDDAELFTKIKEKLENPIRDEAEDHHGGHKDESHR